MKEDPGLYFKNSRRPGGASRGERGLSRVFSLPGLFGVMIAAGFMLFAIGSQGGQVPSAEAEHLVVVPSDAKSVSYCHKTSSASNPWNLQTTSYQGYLGHFTESGTTDSGHEEDYVVRYTDANDVVHNEHPAVLTDDDCGGTPPPDAPTLTISKSCVGGTESFDFVISAAGTAAGEGSVDDIACGGSSSAITLDAGVAYTVTEGALPANWTLSNRNCTGDDFSNSGADGVTFTPEAGDDVTCTFTNTEGETQEPTTSLTIRKLCEPDDDPGLFDIRVDGNIFGTGNEVPCGGGTGTVDIEPGNYDVTETADGETDITDYSVAFSGDCDSEGNVTIAEDEDAVCVITNTRDEEDATTIRIVKDTNPETNDIEFDFDGDLGDFDLEDDESASFNNVTPGSYEVTENLFGDWELVDINCSGTGVVFDIDEGDETVTITIEEGEDAVCTFVNERDTPPNTQVPPTPTTITQTFVPTPTATPVRQVQGVQVTPAPVAPVRALPSTGSGGYLDEGDSSRYLWISFVGFIGLGVTGLLRLNAMRRDQE